MTDMTGRSAAITVLGAVLLAAYRASGRYGLTPATALDEAEKFVAEAEKRYGNIPDDLG